MRIHAVTKGLLVGDAKLPNNKTHPACSAAGSDACLSNMHLPGGGGQGHGLHLCTRPLTFKQKLFDDFALLVAHSAALQLAMCAAALLHHVGQLHHGLPQPGVR
jgi:hypothetical protein